ncbi:hypothetical protein [Rubripirellula reticaptiva]|nr:hypothetical protein [Rubripirellula reticaptiva]
MAMSNVRLGDEMQNKSSPSLGFLVSVALNFPLTVFNTSEDL